MERSGTLRLHPLPARTHGSADTLEKWEALLPWNVPLERISKTESDFLQGK